MKIQFRSILEIDFEFLWRLHNAALKEYVGRTWGWDENWQRKDFLEKFNTGDGEIIVFEGKDIGFLWVIETENEILLASIRLLPEFQKRRVGTRIIRDLIEKSNKPVKLQVLKVNPARGLYERLGFKISGETETHYWMRKE